MDKIFIEDGHVWTSAGMSAGTDLVVGMIERDLGPDRARAVAKGMLMYHRRSGGQSQHSALLDLGASEDRIQKASATPGEIFAKASRSRVGARLVLNPRQSTRLFRSET